MNFGLFDFRLVIYSFFIVILFFISVSPWCSIFECVHCYYTNQFEYDTTHHAKINYHFFHQL